MTQPYPKIELHVHLEGSVRPTELLRIARRNDFPLPTSDEASMREFYRFRDFEHFIELWITTTPAIQTEEDFRDVVLGYAREAASHGAVYLEAIFTPAERITGGASWDEVFTGFCDGAALAEQETGVIVRLTPDIPRGYPLDVGIETARYAVKYRDRGVVGLGLGGLEAPFPPEPYETAFAIARDGGIGSVPHAGEVAGPESIRGALDALGADRLRHGIRAVEDADLLAELADRQIVCDVCPISNVRTRAVDTIADHPLPAMIAAGVPCTISTDDPAMFETEVALDYAVAEELGLAPRDAFAAGVLGALCDGATRARLVDVLDTFAWGTG